MKRSNLIILTLSLFCSIYGNLVNGKSYIPKYVEGNPLEGRILTIDPPDLRKKDLYRIDHKVYNGRKKLKSHFPERPSKIVPFSELESISNRL